MKPKLFEFFLVYILIPAIAIPAYVVKTDRWFALFGILFYLLGVLISTYKQWIFFPIPLIFCVWYWYTYGVSLSDYVAFYCASFICGICVSEIRKSYNKFVHKVLPEQMNNLEYDSKIEELNRRIEKYKKDHPEQKITHELVEKIRTDVFFHDSI